MVVSCPGADPFVGRRHAFHSRELRTYGASRESQLGSDVISSQAAAAAKKGHDAAAAEVEKLLSWHGHTRGRSLSEDLHAKQITTSILQPPRRHSMAYTRH
jgi:hypothetical protein